MSPDQPRRRTADANPSVLMARIEALERRNIVADNEHIVFRASDSQTAVAVQELSRVINDPRNGLIVELEKFRAEVRNDRKVFKAWIAGAAAVISVIYAIVTVYAPLIQKLLGIPQT